MKYRDMVKFLNENNIFVMQPVIASEVSNQLESDISDEEFEEMCDEIYEAYLYCDKEPDIWNLVHNELVRREYKFE